MSAPITEHSHPKVWAAFEDWFASEGWGAENISQLSELGWDAWWSDFSKNNGPDNWDILLPNQ